MGNDLAELLEPTEAGDVEEVVVETPETKEEVVGEVTEGEGEETTKVDEPP